MILCRLGWHRWYVSRTESIRYGVIVTERCRRGFCPAKRSSARW